MCRCCRRHCCTLSGTAPAPRPLLAVVNLAALDAQGRRLASRDGASVPQAGVGGRLMQAARRCRQAAAQLLGGDAPCREQCGCARLHGRLGQGLRRGAGRRQDVGSLLTCTAVETSIQTSNASSVFPHVLCTPLSHTLPAGGTGRVAPLRLAAMAACCSSGASASRSAASAAELPSCGHTSRAAARPAHNGALVGHRCAARLYRRAAAAPC